MRDVPQQLKDQFNNMVQLKEKRPGIHQLLAPLYYEDGDMVEIYLEFQPTNGARVRICDYGMTLMRLSYSYEVDTPNKEKIFQRILSENQLQEDNGNLFMDIDAHSIGPSVLHFAQTVAKIASMQYFRREVIASLFYEQLYQFVMENLRDYHPQPNVFPIKDRDDLEVDYELSGNGRPLFLFGVKDLTKARLTTISCLEFQKAKLPFRSLAVHEEFENLPRKDRIRVTSACDKQFPSLDDFRQNAISFLVREVHG